MVDCDDMGSSRKAILEKRRQLRQRYNELFDAASALLFRHDPVGIVFEHNKDEYVPEVGTILPRLQSCRCKGDVLPIVYEEFLHWFSEAAGPRERYIEISSELWELWQGYQGRQRE
jgi:hypothetical protein